MKVKSRPINNGETFICSFSAVKSLFKKTEIHLDFAYLGRTYSTFARTPDAFYLKKNVLGRIVASSYMSPNRTDPILSFFPIKRDEVSTKLIEEFENIYLQKFYDLYMSLLDFKSCNDFTQLIMVELLDGKLKLHEFKY